MGITRSATATPADDGSVNVLCARCHSAQRRDRRSGRAPVFWRSGDAAGEKRAREEGAVQDGRRAPSATNRAAIRCTPGRHEQREQRAEDARQNAARVLAENVDRVRRADAAVEEVARPEPHERRRAGDRRDRGEGAQGQRGAAGAGAAGRRRRGPSGSRRRSSRRGRAASRPAARPRRTRAPRRRRASATESASTNAAGAPRAPRRRAGSPTSATAVR